MSLTSVGVVACSVIVSDLESKDVLWFRLDRLLVTNCSMSSWQPRRQSWKKQEIRMSVSFETAHPAQQASSLLHYLPLTVAYSNPNLKIKSIYLLHITHATYYFYPCDVVQTFCQRPIIGRAQQASDCSPYAASSNHWWGEQHKLAVCKINTQ